MSTQELGAWRAMEGGGQRTDWAGFSGCVVQHGYGGTWGWWCRSDDDMRCEGYASSEDEAKCAAWSMLRAMAALDKPEVLTVTIQHGEDDLREWQGYGRRRTFDRRAIVAVLEEDDGSGRIVLPGSDATWAVGASYDELVAWWRGGR